MRLSCLLALLACALTGCTSHTSQGVAREVHASTKDASATLAQAVVLASPGRIEGRSDTIEVGAAIDGVVSAVLVQEGQQVTRDTVLAEINCPDLRAQLDTAKASVESFRQVRARLLRGSRDEERLAAEQRTAAAKAVLGQSTLTLRRTKELVQGGVMARSVLDEAQRDFDVAEARLREAVRQEELVKAPPMQEDVAKSEADIQVAERHVTSLEQQISKCTVKAPISGTVLRVLLRPGESFSTITPKPLLTLADLTGRRVRAEVDEKDVAKVSVGQKVFVTSEGQSSQRFTGHVTRLASTMGRRKTASGDPSEKSDRDILEALVEFDQPANSLPLGLRVVVQFADMRPN